MLLYMCERDDATSTPQCLDVSRLFLQVLEVERLVYQLFIGLVVSILQTKYFVRNVLTCNTKYFWSIKAFHLRNASSSSSIGVLTILLPSTREPSTQLSKLKCISNII